ncbi:hypothetical protein KCH_76950 [Kitasatospora cheerisanensis KCTC 2395]|uniref:Uncharacterized protein n=1 Tax=Kitasatospora cheerisanensis KCTC 2395 TaxID=1348663 RepID=A0A066YGC2_9ACTN|nr:hypothetical protein KCH_76950 [Kitasatospora cheerisanensis KCTC 2395]
MVRRHQHAVRQRLTPARAGRSGGQNRGLFLPTADPRSRGEEIAAIRMSATSCG